MWHSRSGNKSYSKYLSFQSHKGHVERMMLSRPTIDNKTPKQFSFLHNSAIKRCILKEQNIKRKSDNYNLFGKMVELQQKGSPYNSNCLQPIFSFPNERPNYHSVSRSEQKDIIDENSKMYNRLKSAKPAYSAKKYVINPKKHRCLMNNISNVPYNPYMNYAPLASFKRNLSIHLQREYGERDPIETNHGTNNELIRNNTSQGFYSPHYSQMVKIHRRSMKIISQQQQQTKMNNSQIQSETHYLLR